MKSAWHPALARRQRSAGLGLPELLTALALAGVLLAAGTLWLQVTSRASRDLQAVLELQEQTRSALDLLESEVRQAGAYGLLSSRTRLAGSAALATAEPIGLAVGGRCVTSLAHDLDHPVQWKTWNGGTWPLVCAAGPDGRAMPASDIIVTRRATVSLGSDDFGTLWVESTPAAGRMRNGLAGAVLPANAGNPSGTTAATVAGPTQALLAANAFYVSRDSTGVRNQPSLRRKQLLGGTAGPRFEDEELVPGVERLSLSLVPSPPGTSGKLVLLAITARSLRTPTLKRTAQRMVLLRNGVATPWP